MVSFVKKTTVIQLYATECVLRMSVTVKLVLMASDDGS